MPEQKIKVGITQGDINGVGWELILKIFSDNRMCELCTPIIYGSSKVAAHYKKLLSQGENIQFATISSAREAHKGKVNIIECGDAEVKPGVATPEAGKAAIEALSKATSELKSGILDAIVTAPFNKESVQSEEFNFPGHTEYITEQLGGESMMMMCSEILKVGLVTKHIPIHEIGNAITKELIIKDLKTLRATLKSDFAIVEPRIAVLALNPHSGDGGLIGKEEVEIIKPAIVEAYSNGVLAFGPFAADGFFAAETYRKYDAVLAMYHDQGLIPFKTLSPEGVNYTAGLCAIRTSPDHGVAYDIAGQGVADPASMRNAIYMTIDIAAARHNYRRMISNPLPRAEREKSHRDMSIKDLPQTDNH